MNGLVQVLDDITQAQFRTAAHRRAAMRAVTEREMAWVYEEAQAIHHANIERAPDPIYDTMPKELHEWAIRRISVNIIARGIGLDLAAEYRPPYGS